jgi:hypothetical protein
MIFRIELRKTSKGGPKNIFCPSFMKNICGHPIYDSIVNSELNDYTNE